MGNFFVFFSLYMMSTFLLNLSIKSYFDKLTNYNNIELHWMPFKFIVLYMFFGYILLFFHKRVKEYRKVIYMENYIRHMDFMYLTRSHYRQYDDVFEQKYINFKRYLKLKKIKNKSNRIF